MYIVQVICCSFSFSKGDSGKLEVYELSTKQYNEESRHDKKENKGDKSKLTFIHVDDENEQTHWVVVHTRNPAVHQEEFL